MAATLIITLRLDDDDDANEAVTFDCKELMDLFYGINDGQVRGEILSVKIADYSEPVDLQALIDADEDEDYGPRLYGYFPRIFRESDDAEECAAPDKFPRIYNPDA